jgi:heterodisulfide reductase subunit A2
MQPKPDGCPSSGLKGLRKNNFPFLSAAASRLAALRKLEISRYSCTFAPCQTGAATLENANLFLREPLSREPGPLNLKHQHVAVIGAGVAGLTAADQLARSGLQVSVIEKSPFLGGHAVQLCCKATDACVKCGACVAEEKLQRACSQAQVDFYTGTTLRQVTTEPGIVLDIETHSPLVNAEKCNGCGVCLQKCPATGALMQGKTPRLGPYVAIRRELCRFFDDAACTLCRDVCPQGAITLADHGTIGRLEADAIVLATGFSPYNPSSKPFGYQVFDDVVTNLDAERILREHCRLQRPSDGRLPGRLAFIQCVGSRDARLGHPWCSKICCASSLRMARLIQARQPGTQVTFFYIDIQTFGRDFQKFYAEARQAMVFVRAIAGDIFKTADGRLRVVYFDPKAHEPREALFDMVILSAGLAPGANGADLSRMLHWNLAPTGFFQARSDLAEPPRGIFAAGAALGPMSIAESVASAGRAVWQVLDYLAVENSHFRAGTKEL